MIKLVAFLGNFGEKYARTRHNVAWIFSDFFLPGCSWSKKFKGEVASFPTGDFLPFAEKVDGKEWGNSGGKILFLRPHTYMNLSGQSVSEAVSFFKVDPSEILVVHDELELPFATVSLKFGGGLGGHNGLRSMKECLGTADFYRLRFGIGRPENGTDVANYVLQPFTSEQFVKLEDVFQGIKPLMAGIICGECDYFLKNWGKKVFS